MKNRNALLRGAAMGAMMLAVAGAANAKPVKHHAKRTYGAAPVATYAGGSELGELRSEVQALRAQLDAQAQNQAAIQAQVAQTQAQTAQIAADAESVQDRLDNVPAQVLTTIGELPKAKPSWAEKTQITGRVYLDASNIVQKNNGQRVAPSGAAVDIKRFYLGVDHQFNDIYSANVTTDFQYASSAPAATGNASTIAQTELYIKKAYLQAKYLPWFTVRLGAADLPWIPFVEDLYGYRYVEQTLTDRTKFGTSADWGIHAFGSFDPIGDPKTGPVVSYAVAVINGTGYRSPPGTSNAPRTNTLDVEGRVSVKYMDFTAALGGYHGRLGVDKGTTLNATYGPVAFRDASRFNALLAYTSGPIRAGVEYFTATNWTAVGNRVTGDKADGYSVFGSYQFQPEWGVFGRYDYVKPTKTTASTKKDNYFNIGLQYEPAKIVDLSLVYKRDKVDNGTFSTGNGTIGATVLGGNGTYDEVGLFGQYRW